MRSPLAALAWEIWRRGHRAARLAIGCLVFCALINLAVPERLRASDPGHDLFNTLFGMLMVMSMFLIMGIFNYTEYSSSREWNGFPYRLFTLPIRTWQLVTLPMLLGVVSVELVYMGWINLVWTREEIPGVAWFAVVLGAYMVFYQGVLWSLAGFRMTRMVVLGLGGASGILVACLPMFSKIVPSPWFAEERLVACMVVITVFTFLGVWTAIARQRCGGGRRQSWIKDLLERLGDAMPRSTKDFASPSAAQFWFEWRRGGWLLPVCTGLVLLALMLPFSWVERHDPASTMKILPQALATPLVLAFAIGKAFVKPELWSMDFSLPAFLAIRPLPSEELVISKLKVAAVSVAIAWLLVAGFLALWLPLWADTTQLQPLLFELRAFYPHSWQTITVLFLAAFMVLTWRCLVSGLWIGLSGSRFYYVASSCLQVIVPALLLLTAGLCSERIDAEIRDHANQVNALALAVLGWLLALAVIAKLWFAVFAWSKVTARRTWQFLLLWSVATLSFVALGIISRPWADTFRQEHLYLLAAFLIFPFARLGLAPGSLTKNRHR